MRSSVEGGAAPTKGSTVIEFPPFDDPWWLTPDAALIWDLFGPNA
ncbi:hypothetical protein [Microbacterium sp. K24]|jgi:hypothetical protein|nr:hypothetical protein [Microbacterium sp. K24]